MRQLTSFDHLAIANELKDLIGRRYTKFSNLPTGYKLKIGSADILFLPPDRLYKTNYTVPASSPDAITQKVRKELRGLKLEDVRTLNLDRVVMLDFGMRKLVFELFREGNILLLDENGTIVSVLYPGSWRHRELKVGVMYKTPPEPAISRRELLLDSTLLKDLIRSGVPRPYALEVIHRLGLEPSSQSTSVNPSKLLSVLEDLLSSLHNPSGYICENEPYPIPLSYLPCEKRFDTFNEAIDSFTPSLISLEEEQGKEKKPSKLDYMLKSLQELDAEIEALQSLLNEIYENWSAVEEMLVSRKFRDVGKLKFKGMRGKEAIFDFTP